MTKVSSTLSMARQMAAGGGLAAVDGEQLPGLLRDHEVARAAARFGLRLLMSHNFQGCWEYIFDIAPAGHFFDQSSGADHVHV